MKNTLLYGREYFTPTLHAIQLSLERGFAASLENPETDPEIPWLP